jgi:hypothetical protein
MYKLGLDPDNSDYDTNLSSDAMVAKARAHWDGLGQPGSFLSGDHEYVNKDIEYVNKDIAREAFPAVNAWANTWSDELHLRREVSWAVFPSSGPKDVSATSGHYAHFQDSDWIVFRPGGS